MLLRLSIAVLLSMVLAGCASTHTIDTQTKADIDLLNQRLNARPATVYLRDHSFSHGRALLVRSDSTFWVEQGTKRQRAVASDAIYAIEAAAFRSPLVYRKSFAIGFTAGYISMAALHLSKDDPARISTSDVFLTLGASVATGMIGAIIHGSHSPSYRTPGRFILNEQP